VPISTEQWYSTTPTTRSSPISPRGARAPRSRLSCSRCWPVLFDKDKIYAYLNLDDNELFIYQRLYDLLLGDVVPPDLVIYLQIPTDVLRRRIRSRDREYRENGETPPDPEYLGELNDAYTHFFFHYVSTPLLVVETSHVDLEWGDTAMNDLLKQVRGMGQGTRYYVPR